MSKLFFTTLHHSIARSNITEKCYLLLELQDNVFKKFKRRHFDGR